MRWIELPLTDVVLPGWGWREKTVELRHQLEQSVRAHGQLRPLVVRDLGGSFEIVDGRLLVTVLRELGYVKAVVLDLGVVTVERAQVLAMSLDLRQEMDYVSLAKVVSAVIEARPDYEDVIPATTSINGEDIKYYVTLSNGFDWDQFHESLHSGQDVLFDEHEGTEGYQAEPIGELEDEPAPAPAKPKKPAPAAPLLPLRPLRPEVPEVPEVPATSLAPLPTLQGSPGGANGPEASQPPQPPPVSLQGVPEGFLAVLQGSGSPGRTSLAETLPDAPAGGVEFFGTDTPVTTWRPEAPPQLDGITHLQLDAETDGLEWFNGALPIGLALRLPSGHTQYLPFRHRMGLNLDEDVVKRWAQTELRGKRITNLNTKFDVHMLRQWGVDLEEQGCTVGDVAHYAALLDDNRRQFSLDALGVALLGRGKKLLLGIDKNHMADTYPGEIEAYAREDVQLVAELEEKMTPLLDAEDLQRVRQLEDDLIFPVCEMEKNGAPLQTDLLKAWDEESKELLRVMSCEVNNGARFAMNPDKASDWHKLFETLGIPVESRTEGGAASFTDKVLARIDHPVVQAARRSGKLASLRSKYIVPYLEMVEKLGVLRYNLHQLRADTHGTVSGRFSASDKNIQQVMNVERQIESFGSDQFLIRRLFVPASGLFLSADARQIEYRLFGHYSAAASVLEAYLRDPLTSFHLLVQQMVEQFRPGFSYERTKVLNFMKLYGGGREHTAELLDLPLAESNEFVDLYDSTFPEAKALLKSAARRALQQGFVRTHLGRRARFPEKEFTHKALNRVIQGTAADIMKTKIVELHRERKHTGFLMRTTVHDEVNGDAPDLESARRVEEILNRQSFPFRVPILWKVGTGPNWAEAK
jgi:DNA polymerase I-like protein with 3'-5' exonuclease and polymerase domains